MSGAPVLHPWAAWACASLCLAAFAAGCGRSDLLAFDGPTGAASGDSSGSGSGGSDVRGGSGGSGSGAGDARASDADASGSGSRSGGSSGGRDGADGADDGPDMVFTLGDAGPRGDGSTCGASCPGCCDDGLCVSGLQELACGAGGGACTSCSPELSCVKGVCH